MDAVFLLGIFCLIVTIPFMLYALWALLNHKELPISFVAAFFAFIFGVYAVGKDILPKLIIQTNGESPQQTIIYPRGCREHFNYDGHTYCVCVRDDIDSFQDAERLCKEYGGHLATINSKEENSKLYDYFIEELGYQSAYFGYTDHETEGEWEWVDKSPNGRDGAFTSWMQNPLQPDNGGVSDGDEREEDYALFWHKDPDYTWNDGDFRKDRVTDTVIFLIEWDYIDGSLQSPL